MSKKKIDKRTKAYKDSIKNKPAKGLGDIVEDITKATGIKKAVKAIFGDDCGCEERKKRLNQIEIPRFKTEEVHRCFTEEQYKMFGEYKKNRTLETELDTKSAQLIIDLYAHVFAIQHNINDFCRNCGKNTKLRNMNDKLDAVYESYKNDIV